jgi:hypothetical protein
VTAFAGCDPPHFAYSSKPMLSRQGPGQRLWRRCNTSAKFR